MSGSNIVNANLDKWFGSKIAGVQGLSMIIASQAAAKSKALPQSESWKDDTHHARQGLYGKAGRKGTEFIIELGHRVDYGPALELANDGKYGILEKKLNSRRLVVYNRVKQIMESKI